MVNVGGWLSELVMCGCGLLGRVGYSYCRYLLVVYLLKIRRE